MARVVEEFEVAEQPEVNRLVVGAQSLRIESFQPLGDIWVRTPSRRHRLHHAARAEVRCGADHAVYLFGESQPNGRLVGVRAA
ncbi:MAG TPA: hypothetical protein VFH45_10215 [Acidimicrobiales bacterium]|nr:hypothetical protein [Acidimicrobiales bacterium]